MTNNEITDPVFRRAVEAIDSGNTSLLEELLTSNPALAAKRLEAPTEGYFQHPYLLWFVADNPIRSGKLPVNIVDITRLLIKYVRNYAAGSFQQQIDYALALVESGRIPRECGVQIGLIDLLLDNGANPGDAHEALTHGNMEAARHIVDRSGSITLTAAVCLDRVDNIVQLLPGANKEDMQVAFMAAAFYGKTDMLSLLLKAGADVNAYIQRGFHTHASPLHQAVSSGSLEAVRLLVEAGANLQTTDKIYSGTPLDWAMYLQNDVDYQPAREKYKEIEAFLANKLSALS
jgi:hypothetical protein